MSGDPDIPRLEDPSVPAAAPPRSPILTGLIVALLLIVVSIAVFQLLGDDDGDDGPTAATTTSPPTTAQPTETTTGDGVTETTTGTTSPDPTLDPTTTTNALGLPEDVEPYVAIGEQIPLDNLRMAVDGLGPVQFGQPAAEAMGRLIASFGQPDEDTGPIVSTGEFGVCNGDTERRVRWGPLVAIVVVDDDGTETFGGYRLDFAYATEGLSSEATELQTLSGFKAGQSVVALREVYENFEITFSVVEGLDTVFELKSRNSGNLLLWGPVTSEDTNGIVLGIYAPDACGRF